MTNDQKVRHLLTNDETCSSLGDELFSSFVTASERQLSKDGGCLYWTPHRIGWEDRPRRIGGSLSLVPPPDRVGGPPPREQGFVPAGLGDCFHWIPPLDREGDCPRLTGNRSAGSRDHLYQIGGTLSSERGPTPQDRGRDRFRRVDVRSDFVISEAILGVTQGEMNVATLPRGNFLG